MPTIGSITKTVRINPIDLAVLGDIMRKNDLTWSGVIHYLIESRGVPQNDKGVPKNNGKIAEGCTPKTENSQNGVYPEDGFKALVKDLRMPYDMFYSEIVRLTDSGELLKEGDHLAVHEQRVNLTEFLEVCHEVGADPQKILSDAIKGMRKGK